MALTDKLTAIADAIRAKTGKTETMTLDAMPSEIEGLHIEGLLPPADYPDYVRDEVLEIVNKVRNVKTDDSIVFIAMSDSHYPADETGSYAEETVKSAVQANQAAKALTYMLGIDFVAHLGDVSWGGSATTPEMLKKQIEDFISYFKEAGSTIPCFIAIGNHDAGIYYHDTVADGNVYTLPGEYLYENFTAHSASDDTVIGGEEYGGYCYRDFADKKLRVIMLNTSEKLVSVQTDCGSYGAQRVWLANTLLDLNSKTDAAEWGFIILCHYPADYGDNMSMSAVLKAYVDGTSVTITDTAGGYYQGDGTNQTVNFTGNNAAKFLAQFHGHVHNFKADKLSVYENGSKVTYDAWRICIPNGQFNRENYYTTIGAYTDINFGEDKSYPKTVDSENGTSFVVNVINPSEEKIYSFTYGAGYDRVIGTAATVYYSITTNLTNITLSNSVNSVEEGESYNATFVYDETGYYFEADSVVVTMGGEDITSSVYADGTINIPAVTGNVVITANALQRGAYTNMIPLSTTTLSGTELYNPPYGYKTGYRVDSSDNEVAVSNMCCTGYIPLSGNGGEVIRIKNITVAGGASAYFIMYNANDTQSAVATTEILTNGGTFNNHTCVVENGLITITVSGTGLYSMRLSVGVIDETSIITVNEPIL